MALAFAAGASGCLLGSQVRPDIAVIEGGDAVIYRLDRVWLKQASSGSFDVQPGGHTVDVTSTSTTPIPFGAITHRSGLTSLCVKAKPGHRYRIKSRFRDGKFDMFFVDAATGEPPKTPCGPDEDDD